MAPSAPGLLSTTKRWPSFASIPGDRVLNIASETLPAANGITTRIGFVGQSWARPAAGASTIGPATRNAKMRPIVMSPRGPACERRFYIGMTDARQPVRRFVRLYGKHLPLADRGGDLPQTGGRGWTRRGDPCRLRGHSWLSYRRAAGPSSAGCSGEARLRSARP